jgi:hydroxyethylthiazole kinase-like uncharacterized protein yjeF
MQKLFTVKQISTIEQWSIAQQFNGDDFILMQRAGLAVFNKIIALYNNLRHFIIFCGQGNNGGDGFVVAKLAAENKYNVTVVFLGEENRLTTASAKAYAEYIKQVNNQNINLLTANTVHYASLAQDNAIYVDAIFGTGLNKEPTGIYKEAIEYLCNRTINKQAIIFAIDIPSGLQADTGFAYKSAVKATATLTFIGLKQGLLTAAGLDHCGELFLDTLGITDDIYQKIEASCWLLDAKWANICIQDNLPKRDRNSHKHQFGHVVIIGSDYGMPGAVIMAGQAALRVGAGLATVITHSEHNADIVSSQPELMVYGVSNNMALHRVAVKALLNKASVIILGPGLGQSTWSQDLFNLWLDFIIEKPQVVTVIDADGLNLLSDFFEKAENKSLLVNLKKANLILTPHPGEARKLLHYNVDVGADRFSAVKIISTNYNAVTILKGVGSLIYDGYNNLSLCQAGNPGLASAGTGDILTGIIGGLLAQGLSRYDAACLAVYLHATAADLQAKKYGERGLLATDLLLELRKLLNNI